ncbi:MAG: O-antigen ligase family protein, partial [Solirubrobacterales bacterium]|nr:O-antigen ligase family protein [Solirubrobacterales bacterium]
GRAWGGGTLLLFGALAALTFASIGWSVDPSTSWVEANRTLSYLAAFGSAIALARLAPARWRAVIGAVALCAAVVSAYALLAKVFPSTFDPSTPVGRLRAPFGYYNATGLMAAFGLPACLWAGARRDHSVALRALSVPVTGILVAVLLLSVSRGALLAAVVGLGCWFVLVPLRLRAALVLGLGAAGAAAMGLWAFSHHALTHDYQPLHARTTAGHEFGVVVLVSLILLTIAGFLMVIGMDRVSTSPTGRRRIGTALVVLVALVLVGGLVALAGSTRGFTGEVSHIWTKLTSTRGAVNDNPGRLVELSNSRPLYWSEGLKVGEHSLLKGVGALGYAVARERYASQNVSAGHAHSFVIETFADFGLIGIALSLALLVAWGVAVARTLRPWTRVPTEHAAEHAGLLTLFALVLIFGIHSAIDWTWFFPGVAVSALVCAGWLAGRGPLAQPIGRSSARRHLTRAPAAAALTAAIAAAAIFAAWVIWQPLRSANADAAANVAAIKSETSPALADARTAASVDPVATQPLWELAAIYEAAGDLSAARSELLKAVSVAPSNPQTWSQLAAFDLGHHQPRLAGSELHRASELDPSNPSIARLMAEARAQIS